MADQRKQYLKLLEDALWEDDPQALPPEEAEKLPPSSNRRIRADFGRTVYEDDRRDAPAVYEDRQKPKGAGGLVLLALLELAGIAAIIGWWIKWLG